MRNCAAYPKQSGKFHKVENQSSESPLKSWKTWMIQEHWSLLSSGIPVSNSLERGLDLGVTWLGERAQQSRSFWLHHRPAAPQLVKWECNPFLGRAGTHRSGQVAWGHRLSWTWSNKQDLQEEELGQGPWGYWVYCRKGKGRESIESRSGRS